MAAPDSRDAEQVLHVTVDDVIFRSDDGRFAVVRATTHGSPTAGARQQALPTTDTGAPDATTAAHDREQVVIVGDLGGVAPGETLRVRGRWTTHATYGKRFSAVAAAPVMPTTGAGMARYLGSGLVPGVGPALAERLVRRFGERTIDVITSQSARLVEVDGIGKKRARAIAEAVRARRDEAETMSYLAGLGLGPATARRILKRYGDDTVSIVRDDPYLVAEQVRGIGFRTADRIGRAAGIGDDDPRRAAGAVLHLLGRAADEGHVYLPIAELIAGARDLQVPPDGIERAVTDLAARELVRVDGDAVYAPPLHEAEVRVAERLRDLAGAERRPGLTRDAVESRLPGDLTATQRSVVWSSLTHGLVVLTGGPGTGKTTTVRAVVEAHERAGRRVELCAPTGRAAKRLSEATGTEARTIHRLLEFNPGTGRFRRDARTPIDAELVLVDEASMLDVRLAASLVDAVGPAATLVLVGDVDQLPPVGPGHVLRELIRSGVAEVVRLREIFRQAQRSAIVRGAHAILDGRVPTPTSTGTHSDGDLFIVRAREPQEMERLLASSLRRMTEAYGLDAKRDVQVLSPMRRGPAGTQRLNELLQAELNPGATPGGLRPGDKVMQLRNDYDRDVYNGDLGIVRRVEGGITYVDVDGREVQYEPDDLDSVALAYASTVHKVQGSEFPAIVVVLHASHWVLLSRALLYTAVTRAKRLVVLLGDGRALARAARNAETYRSHSRLVERLTV